MYGSDNFGQPCCDPKASVLLQTSALWKFTRYLILTALPFKLVNDVSQFVGPTFLNLLLGVVSSGQPSSVGYTYAIIMLTLLIIGTAADNQHFQRVMRGGKRCNMAVHICVPACMQFWQFRGIWAIWVPVGSSQLGTAKLCTEKFCRPNMAGISAQQVMNCTKYIGTLNCWTHPRTLMHQSIWHELQLCSFASHWLASGQCLQLMSMFPLSRCQGHTSIRQHSSCNLHFLFPHSNSRCLRKPWHLQLPCHEIGVTLASSIQGLVAIISNMKPT